MHKGIIKNEKRASAVVLITLRLAFISIIRYYIKYWYLPAGIRIPALFKQTQDMFSDEDSLEGIHHTLLNRYRSLRK